MSIPLTTAADLICRIDDASRSLEQVAKPLGLPSLVNLEWYRTLSDKLIPQLTKSPFLVVAVVGGTNIGKSLIFNHIVGEKLSESSSTASGTKHPVLVVPTGFLEAHDVKDIFRGFDVTPWENANQALEAGDGDILLWQTSSVMPENLLVLDTPDIDSDARVNWDRADRIRRSADVLICVLTNQKYNDAAVRRFFEKAADEGQVVIVVFNQMTLPDDEAYWPDWLGTFCEQTGVSPELLYLSPNDRQAARNLRLPFSQRSWPAVFGESNSPTSLLSDLSELHFDEIKIRTLTGGLNQVTESVPAYLKLVQQRSEALKRVEQRLVNELSSAHRTGWPTLPNDLLRAAVKRWWAAQRTGWVRSVTNVYGTLSDGIDAGVQGVRGLVGSEPLDSWAVYRDREWTDGVLATVEQLFVALESLQESSPAGVVEEVTKVLKKADRAKLLDDLKTMHASIDLEAELQRVVDSEMNRFKTEKANAHALLKKLDTAAAAARPAITAGLFLVGAGPLVEVGVAGTALNLAADAAGGTAASVVGEKLLGEGAGRAFSTLQDWFHGLHAKFIATRAAWLKNELEDRLLGELPKLLAAAAVVGESEPYRELKTATQELESLLHD